MSKGMTERERAYVLVETLWLGLLSGQVQGEDVDRIADLLEAAGFDPAIIVDVIMEVTGVDLS